MYAATMFIFSIFRVYFLCISAAAKYGNQRNCISTIYCPVSSWFDSPTSNFTRSSRSRAQHTLSTRSTRALVLQRVHQHILPTATWTLEVEDALTNYCFLNGIVSIVSNEDHVTVLPSMVEIFLTEVRRETLASKWIPKLKAWNMKTELNDVHNKEFYRFESTAVDPYHLIGSLSGYYWPILWMYWLNFDNSFSWTSVFRYQFR